VNDGYAISFASLGWYWYNFLLLSGIHFPHRFDYYRRATRLCSTSCL